VFASVQCVEQVRRFFFSMKNGENIILRYCIDVHVTQSYDTIAFVIFVS
jgi:hypothetical protein